jgi:hypothetical protein
VHVLVSNVLFWGVDDAQTAAVLVLGGMLEPRLADSAGRAPQHLQSCLDL